MFLEFIVWCLDANWVVNLCNLNPLSCRMLLIHNVKSRISLKLTTLKRQKLKITSFKYIELELNVGIK